MRIDLRSDTVTRPTEAMRRAMATAEVGDDVYGEDPTIRRLEERAAELLGREAGLFVPTGTMGNQIAVHLHSHPGSEVIGEAGCHIFNFEMGAMAAISGALPRAIVAEQGLLEAEDVAAAIQPNAGYRTPTSLLVLENTHNLAGGRLLRPERLASLVAVAAGHELPVHLDGARLFNAGRALGLDVKALSIGCDSVMFCLSKGLAAPVGSMLVASSDFIEEARRVRKMLGGGMRQAGVLAAAGLVALDEMVERLDDDHARARRLAEGLAQLPGMVVELESVETNILMAEITEELEARTGVGAAELARRLGERGILLHALQGRRLRLVTHYEIDDQMIDSALRGWAEVLQELGN